jgi:prepilin peptidase CpaA
LSSLDALLAVVLLASVVSDLRARRVPDSITVPATAIAVMTHLGLAGAGDIDSGAVSSVLGALAAGGFFALVALFGRLGWGDVKLFAFCGAVFGVTTLPTFAASVSLAGLLQALPRLANAKRRSENLPYAVSIAVGAAFTRWWVS